jgi:deazaflavin-dependent oxidoreductase (nitroreductase family)
VGDRNRTEPPDLDALDRRSTLRLTTTGRRSGQPRRITIWFACDGGKIYLAGGRKVPHWSRNIRKNPGVEIEIGGVRFKGKARVLEEKAEADHVRGLIFKKYFLAKLSSYFGGYARAVPVEIVPAS